MKTIILILFLLPLYSQSFLISDRIAVTVKEKFNPEVDAKIKWGEGKIKWEQAKIDFIKAKYKWETATPEQKKAEDDLYKNPLYQDMKDYQETQKKLAKVALSVKQSNFNFEYQNTYKPKSDWEQAKVNFKKAKGDYKQSKNEWNKFIKNTNL